MTLKDLKSVARPIIREAKYRIKLLEKYGLEDSPAYLHIKLTGDKLTAAGNNLNVIRHNIMEAFNFLHASTSIPENAQRYLDRVEKWFPGTTAEDRRVVFEAVHRLEEMYPSRFLSQYYDKEYEKVGSIAKNINATHPDDIVEEYVQIIEREKNAAMADQRTGEELSERGRSEWRRGDSL